MNIQIVEKYLISPQSLENLQPLHHPHTEIIKWEVHPLDTHSKLGLGSGSGGEIVNYVEIVGGSLALLLHYRDSQWSDVSVGLGDRTGEKVRGHWDTWWRQCIDKTDDNFEKLNFLHVSPTHALVMTPRFDPYVPVLCHFA